jgi:hypothetical protein
MINECFCEEKRSFVELMLISNSLFWDLGVEFVSSLVEVGLFNQVFLHPVDMIDLDP